MSADGCLLGRRRWDSDCEPREDSSMVTFWCPTRRVTLRHLGSISSTLAFLALSEFQRVRTHLVSLTKHETTPILTQAKAGKASSQS